MSPEALRGWRREWRIGDQLDFGETLSRWIEGGYEPVTAVEEPGQFSRRGGLIDVWPAGSDRPVRIELFGDEIDSLRPFDPVTQRSAGRLPAVTILPASELPLWERDAALELLHGIDASTLRPEVEQEWRRMLAIIDRGEAPPAPDLLAPYFSATPASLLDYLPDEAIVVFDEPGAVRLAAEQVEAQAEELRLGFEAGGELPKGLLRPYHPWAAVTAKLARAPQLDFGQRADGRVGATLTFDRLGEPAAYAGQMTRLARDLKAYLRGDVRAVVVTEQAERLREILAERDIFPQLAEGGGLPATLPPLTVVQETLSNGWLYEPAPGDGAAFADAGDGAGEGGRNRLAPGALVVLTDHDIFGTVRVVRRASRRTAS
jgi:transcription-repair coupling factor (superfamily II helicase)